VGESGSLALHFGWEQVADGDVEGKPVGVESVNELVARTRVVLPEGIAQHPQRIGVL